MNLSVSIDTKEVLANLLKLKANVPNKAEAVMEHTMTTAENKAKTDAPWTDRTGNARGSITHKTTVQSDAIVGTLAMTVFYGPYLELSRQGKYRIIRPTIDMARADLIRNLRGIL